MDARRKDTAFAQRIAPALFLGICCALFLAPSLSVANDDPDAAIQEEEFKERATISGEDFRLAERAMKVFRAQKKDWEPDEIWIIEKPETFTIHFYRHDKTPPKKADPNGPVIIRGEGPTVWEGFGVILDRKSLKVLRHGRVKF